MATSIKNALRYFVYGVLFVLYIILCAKDAGAQTPDKFILQKAPANVNVDGRMKEWGDSLAYYNSDTKLSYNIAKNDTALFIVVTTSDRQVRRKVTMAGITVSVNPEGKKHKIYSVTYPVPDNTSTAFSRIKDPDSAANFQPKPSLLQSTSIKVEGFKDIESDVITTANTYGFKAAYKFDSKHNLVYEMQIPLNMLNIKPKATSIAVNISVNGIQRPTNPNATNNSFEGGGGGRGGSMGGGGRGGSMGGGGGRGGRGGESGTSEGRESQSVALAQATDFWIKADMAQ